MRIESDAVNVLSGRPLSWMWPPATDTIGDNKSLDSITSHFGFHPGFVETFGRCAMAALCISVDAITDISVPLALGILAREQRK